jgi:hypothetical protein
MKKPGMALVAANDALEAPIDAAVGELHRHVWPALRETFIRDTIEALCEEIVSVFRLELLDLELILETLHAAGQRLYGCCKVG